MVVIGSCVGSCGAVSNKCLPDPYAPLLGLSSDQSKFRRRLSQFRRRLCQSFQGAHIRGYPTLHQSLWDALGSQPSFVGAQRVKEISLNRGLDNPSQLSTARHQLQVAGVLGLDDVP